MILISTDELKAKSGNSGHHWFSKDTMRFFRSRVAEVAYISTVNPNECALVSSEQFVSSRSVGERRYSVNVFDTNTGKHLRKVGGFQQFRSRSGAHAAAKRWALGRAQEAEE